MNTPTVIRTETPTATVTPGTDPAKVEVTEFPNPGNGNIWFLLNTSIDADRVEISIYTLGFRLVYRKAYGISADNKYPAEICLFDSGLYIARVKLMKKGSVICSRVRNIVKLK